MMVRKSKRNENLTLEEKLEQTLVPNWDEPYKLPDNWCWVYLTKGFAHCLDNFRKPVNATERSTMQGDIPYYGATGQVGWINNFLTNEHLVLLGEDGAPFLDYTKDKAYIIDGKSWVNNHVHILKSFYGKESNFYLMHYLNIFDYHGYVNGSTRLKLTQSSMNSIPVPLAPVQEQQRIVKYIETLFAKLDEAKEKAREVVDGFENRKSAILYKAFSGELTAKWRKENNVSDDSWKKTKFKDFCLLKRGFDLPSAKRIDGKYPIVSSSGIIDAHNTACVKGPGVVTGRSGTIGKVIYVETDYWPLNTTLYSENLFENDAKYVSYYLQTFNFKNFSSSTAVPTLNRNKFMNETVFVPSIDEQKEIVKILDKLIFKEQKAKNTAEAVVGQIDTIKKAILARAFRGELGTNDPTEESAVELIKKHIEGTIKDISTRVEKPKLEKIEVNVVVKSIIEALQTVDKLTPERLKVETKLDIDDFYEQLKSLIDSGKVKETRIDGESYLEAVE